MRRRHVVALCLAVGALIGAAIAPGVIARRNQSQPLAPGITVDRQVTFDDGSTLTYGHGFREVKPGEEGYVPAPRKGQKGYEAP